MRTSVNKFALLGLQASLGLIIFAEAAFLAFAPASIQAFARTGLPDWRAAVSFWPGVRCSWRCFFWFAGQGCGGMGTASGLCVRRRPAYSPRKDGRGRAGDRCSGRAGHCEPQMTDQELREQFERGTLPDESFRHREHVRMAFLYLTEYPASRRCRHFPSFAEIRSRAREAPALPRDHHLGLHLADP